MKKILFTASIAILAAACTTNEKSYVITGTLPDDSYNNKMVYMSEYEDNRVLDSTLVTDGTFTFKGNADTVGIRRLSLERLYTNFILEPGEIKVDISNPNKLNNTPLNDKLAEYMSEFDAAENVARSKDEELRNKSDIDDETRTRLLEENYNEYVNKMDALNNRFFSENKDNAVGTFVLWQWSYMLDAGKMDSVYAESGEVIRNNKIIKRIIERNEKKRKTAEGMPFTDFTIEDGNSDGSKVSFSDYVGKGKYVLVDFWASWCGPCIAETPVIAEVYNKYKGDKFEVLGVAVWDKRDATVKAIEQHGITWPQILNAESIPTDIYGIDGIPHIILFGPDGKIIARNLRGDALKAKVAEAMENEGN